MLEAGRAVLYLFIMKIFIIIRVHFFKFFFQALAAVESRIQHL